MSNQVATIEDITQENASLVYVTGGLKPFFEKVRAEVSSEVPDLKTAKGRARIASLAAKVGSSKAAVEKPGREYLKRIKELPKEVEAELREFVNSMNDLRDETRKPLTEWEAADEARISRHKAAIEYIRLRADENSDLDSAELQGSIAEMEAVSVGAEWEEFEAEAHRIKARAIESLKSALVTRQKYEADQAELAQRRADAEAQAQRERDAEIARVAVEQARLEAEQRAQAERDAAARREQELLEQAAATQRAATQAALDAEAAAERQRLQLEMQAEESRIAAARAEADRLAAEQRAEQERIAAAKRQEEAVERARLAEVARQAEEAAETLRQKQAREADSAHKIKILGEAKQALIGMNISEELAKAIVLKIARGEVPNVSIQF